MQYTIKRTKKSPGLGGKLPHRLVCFATLEQAEYLAEVMSKHTGQVGLFEVSEGEGVGVAEKV